MQEWLWWALTPEQIVAKLRDAIASWPSAQARGRSMHCGGAGPRRASPIDEAKDADDEGHDAAAAGWIDFRDAHRQRDHRRGKDRMPGGADRSRWIGSTCDRGHRRTGVVASASHDVEGVGRCGCRPQRGDRSSPSA